MKKQSNTNNNKYGGKFVEVTDSTVSTKILNSIKDVISDIQGWTGYKTYYNTTETSFSDGFRNRLIKKTIRGTSYTFFDGKDTQVSIKFKIKNDDKKNYIKYYIKNSAGYLNADIDGKILKYKINSDYKTHYLFFDIPPIDERLAIADFLNNESFIISTTTKTNNKTIKIIDKNSNTTMFFSLETDKIKGIKIKIDRTEIAYNSAVKGYCTYEPCSDSIFFPSNLDNYTDNVSIFTDDGPTCIF